VAQRSSVIGRRVHADSASGGASRGRAAGRQGGGGGATVSVAGVRRRAAAAVSGTLGPCVAAGQTQDDGCGDAADGARHSTSDAQVAPRQETRRAAAQQRTMEVHFRR